MGKGNEITLGVEIPLGKQHGTFSQGLDGLHGFARDVRLRCRVNPAEGGGGAYSRKAVRAPATAPAGVTAGLYVRNRWQPHTGIRKLPCHLRPEPVGINALSAATPQWQRGAAGAICPPGTFSQFTWNYHSRVRLHAALLMQLKDLCGFQTGRKQPAITAYQALAGRGWLWQP